MTKTRVQLLTEIILDPEAFDHEKDDAAMDLADYDDEEALKALIKVSQSPSENDLFSLDVYGETIVSMWLKNNHFDLNAYLSLKAKARGGIYSILEYRKPEWVEKYELLKHGFKD